MRQDRSRNVFTAWHDTREAGARSACRDAGTPLAAYGAREAGTPGLIGQALPCLHDVAQEEHSDLPEMAQEKKEPLSDCQGITRSRSSQSGCYAEREAGTPGFALIYVTVMVREKTGLMKFEFLCFVCLVPV